MPPAPAAGRDALGVPLMLGVAGPRRIEPRLVEPIRQEIIALCTALWVQYKNTPLVLLSPLVDGADQLVAEAALEAGAQLAVVLPWPGHTIDADPQRYGSPQRYRDLYDRAVHRIEIPWTAGIAAEQVRTDPAAREAQYAAGGRYIARHSQILIAVGDRSEGQTAQMVCWHRHGVQAPYSARAGALDVTKGAAIRHLSLRSPNERCTDCRTSSHSATDELDKLEYPPDPKHETGDDPRPPFSIRPRVLLRWLRRGLVALHHCRESWRSRGRDESPTGKQRLQNRWRAIDEFNRDAAAAAERRPADLDAVRNDLLPAAQAAALGPCVERLLDVYALADAAAQLYQRNNDRSVLTLFATAAAAVAALETYAHLWHEGFVLSAYLALLAVGYGCYRLAKARQYQGRWLDLRALAETLRVQIFWRAAGLPDCTADHYLRHFRGELDWIRHAARAAFFASGGHALVAVDEPQVAAARLSLVRERWILNQLRYFRRKWDAHAKSEIVYETAAWAAFVTAVTFAVVELFLHLKTHEMNHYFVLATFGCLVLAAMLEEYSDIQTYSLMARRYQWMADLFGDADRRLQSTPSDDRSTVVPPPPPAEVLFELGREALAENADWVVQHRQRPPTLPSG